MANYLSRLRLGDKLELQDANYRVSGRLVLRSPDGETWSEWLLVPIAMPANAAIANGVHRWLAHEPEAGLSLWTPAEAPAGLVPDALDKGLQHQGRRYSLRERDSLRVEQVEGDVGGDASQGEQFEYADLVCGLSLMSLEWNEKGMDLCLGRRIGAHDLLNWAREAGNDLRSRGEVAASRLHRARPTPYRHEDEGLPGQAASWIIGILLVGLLLLLEQCGSDRDCRQQLNPATGKVETVCSDGIRSSGRGWGGK